MDEGLFKFICKSLIKARSNYTRARNKIGVTQAELESLLTIVMYWEEIAGKFGIKDPVRR